jgi:hypothetical protein
VKCAKHGRGVDENRDPGVESIPGIEKKAATPPKRLLRASKCLDCRRAHRGWGILQEALVIVYAG